MTLGTLHRKLFLVPVSLFHQSFYPVAIDRARPLFLADHEQNFRKRPPTAVFGRKRHIQKPDDSAAQTVPRTEKTGYGLSPSEYLVLFQRMNMRTARHVITAAHETGYVPRVPMALLTVRERRPLARRELITRRPFLVAMRARKPCLFLLFLLCG